MKNILLTGISKGLGLETAKTILKEGNQYVIYGVSRTSSEALEGLKTEYPGRIHTTRFDVSEVNNVRDIIFKNFIHNKVQLHGVVNNAAMAYDDLVTNLKYEPLELMYRVNVFSPMMITKYAIRNMLLHKTRGSIVHLSSISVHTGYKGLAMYASTKGALEAFSKNTAREWGSLGIRSNTLVAGFMETSMSSGLSDDQKDRIYRRTALKKPTSLTSVAKMITFLLSEEAESITGQNIHVDAGTI